MLPRSLNNKYAEYYLITCYINVVSLRIKRYVVSTKHTCVYVYDHDLLLIYIDGGMLCVRCEVLKFHKLLAQGRSEPVKCDVYKIGLYLVIIIELVLHNVKLSHF